MGSKQVLILPGVIALLLVALWLCYGLIGGGEAPAGLFESNAGGVHAAEDMAALEAPSRDLQQDGVSLSDGRVEIEIDPASTDQAIEEPLVDEFEGPRLRGKVVKPGGGPVAGARVMMSRARSWITTPPDIEVATSSQVYSHLIESLTDSKGEFVLHSVEPGKYSIAISASGFAPLRRKGVQVPVHEDYSLELFTMELGVQLAGKVVGNRGKGVEGVVVLCAVTPMAGFTRLDMPGRGIPLTTTDADGLFEVDTLMPGAWHLIFDSPNHRVAELTGSTTPAGGIERGLVVSLEPGLEIAGTVLGLDPISAGPLRVTARHNDDQPSAAADEIEGSERYRPRHAEVGADGAFVVKGLAAGVQFKLQLLRQKRSGQVKAAVSAESQGEKQPASSTPVEANGTEEPARWEEVHGVDEVVELAGARHVELKYREEAALVLLVKNSETGRPIQEMYVYLSGKRLGGDGILKDDSDEDRLSFPGGAIRYDGLRPPPEGSDVTLRIRAAGFQDFEKMGVMIRPGMEVDLGEVELNPAPIGRVKVIDDVTGKPVEGARVVMAKAGDSKHLNTYAKLTRTPSRTHEHVKHATTDANGVASLTPWTGGICLVRAVAENYLPASEARLTPPFEEMVELRLSRGGEVTVRCVDEAGNAVAGMYIEHLVDGKSTRSNRGWNAQQSAEEKTDEGGVLRFSNLPTGKHSFRALERKKAWGNGGESAGFEASGDVLLTEGESKELELRVDARGQLGVTILESGLPLAGALVKLFPEDGDTDGESWYFGSSGSEDPRSKISDHLGRAKFTGIKVGRYTLKVSHANRRMVTSREVIISTEPDSLLIELGLATIEGTVVDPAGEPIEGVRIRVYSKDSRDRSGDMTDYRVRITEDEDGDTDWDFSQVKEWAISTDREGRYKLRGVTSGTQLVVNASDSHVVGKSETAGPLGSDEFLSPLDFVLDRAGVLVLEHASLRGDSRKLKVTMKRLVADPEGEPLEIRNRTLRSWRSRTTISSLREGRWQVSVSPSQGKQTLFEREVFISVGERTEVTVRL